MLDLVFNKYLTLTFAAYNYLNMISPDCGLGLCGGPTHILHIYGLVNKWNINHTCSMRVTH